MKLKITRPRGLMDKALVFGFHPPKIVRSNRIVVVIKVFFSIKKLLINLTNHICFQSQNVSGFVKFDCPRNLLISSQFCGYSTGWIIEIEGHRLEHGLNRSISTTSLITNI